MGIRGNVKRHLDGHIIHANMDTDVIVSEEPQLGSTEKPEELYDIIERFCNVSPGGRGWAGSRTYNFHHVAHQRHRVELHHLGLWPVRRDTCHGSMDTIHRSGIPKLDVLQQLNGVTAACTGMPQVQSIPLILNK
jgi:hypothetical protein